MKKRLVIKTRYLPSALIAIVAIVVMFAPYQGDSTLGNAGIRSALLYTVYVLSFFAFLFSVPIIRKKKIDLASVLAMVPAVAMLIMRLTHSYSGSNIDGLTTILCILFCLLPKDVERKSFVIFKKIWCVLCVIGVICFFAYVLNLPIPFREVPYYLDDAAGSSYISYGISYLFHGGDMLRLCGFCNEPGYFGTFCALILCVEGMNLRKKSVLVVFLAGVLTASVAFFLIIVIYVVMKIVVTAHKNKDMRRKIFGYVSALVIVLFYFCVLPTVKTGNNTIDETIQRLTVTSEGLSGDNRTTEKFDRLFASTFPSAPLFGMGKGYTVANNVGGNSSYKVYVLEYGVIGCVIIWGSLLMAALYKNTKNATVLLFVIAFCASVYKSPNVVGVQYLILLIGGIEYIKSNTVVSLEGRKNEKSQFIEENVD